VYALLGFTVSWWEFKRIVGFAGSKCLSHLSQHWIFDQLSDTLAKKD